MSEKRSGPGTVSIDVIMARLFAYIAREVIDRFGSEGEAAIRAAVGKFGEDRGRVIAENVRAAGKETTADNYLPYYDMERSELFSATDKATKTKIDQEFSACIFAKAWQDLGMEKYGLLYCEEIDPAIARGYDPKFGCSHDRFLLKGDGCCRFSFEFEDCNK